MTHRSNFDVTTKLDPKKGFRIHLLAFLLGIPAAWIVWYVTDRTYPWPLWSTLAWSAGVLFHYLGVFVFRKKAY